MKVLIVEDHDLVRGAFRELFQRIPGVEVVLDAPDGRSGVETAAAKQPDLVLMDINLPMLNGVDATRLILEAAPSASVLALSGNVDIHVIAKFFQFGGHGYVPKTCSFQELQQAVKVVMEGKRYLSESIPIDQLERVMSRDGMSPAPELSGREREVLQLIAEGQGMQEIGSHLHISPKTVETHRARIMDKLNIHTVAELTKYAIRNGLTSV